MSRAETLEQLARLCRTGRDTGVPPAIEPSGVAELDAALPGGGWPIGTIIELMPMSTGIGELRLLLPTLARFTRTEYYAALISPPYIPLAPALAQRGVNLERLLVVNTAAPEDTLWAFEQTLRCKSFGAALAWSPAAKDREVRRLQLAAESGHSIGFLYRPPSAALETSPAAVRLRLQANARGLSIDILKCRGARSGMSLVISDSRVAGRKSMRDSAFGSSLQSPASSL
jgi:hypothetical protein